MKFENPTLQRVKHRLQTGCTSLKTPLPIVASLDLQVQDFNKPVFLLPLVELQMANTRRSKLKPWKTKPIQATSDPQFALVRNWSFARERLDQPKRNQTQGTSPALVPNIASTSARSTGVATGKLEKLKNLLPFSRSNQTIASTSMSVSAFIQADLRSCGC